MSNYPAWWNTTITLFNRYEDSVTQEVTWYRTVLTNCFITFGKNLTSLGNNESITTYQNIAVCRIPKNTKYLDAYIWNNSDSRSSKFTLQGGDIIFKGKITEDIDEYTKGQRATELIEKYKSKGVFRIGTIQDNSDTTRNLPHYYVTE